MGVVVNTANGLDLNSMVLLIVGLLTLYNNVVARKSHRTIKAIDSAVNQTETPGAPTLREAVEEVKSKVTTPDPSTPSIGEAVEEIAHSLESVPHATDPKGPIK